LMLVPIAPAGVLVLAAALAVLLGLRRSADGEDPPVVEPVGDPA